MVPFFQKCIFSLRSMASGGLFAPLPPNNPYTLFYEALYKEPTYGRNIEGTYTSTERKLRKVSILIIFRIANNQEFGHRFHSFKAKTRVDTFTNFFPS